VLATVLAVWAESAGAADLPSGRSTVNGTLTDAAANAVGAATITHAHGLTEDMARVGFNYRFAH
jgi:hypothetical protein